MKEKKLKISEFIKSMEGDKLDTATCLMGGANGNTAGIMSTTNGGDCINTSLDSCKKSTNNGSCKNAQGMCSNSKNGSNCNNSYKDSISPSNPGNNSSLSC